jgi:cytochrome c-type biogenesis protein CcsB
MIIRWYIGGHAPWSNAYEAMLYISWSMGLAGIVFSRYSILAPALTSVIASAVLFTTILTEMDPQITNLVPVLKSYWLNIHVSVLTASYGFLGLSMILGLFSLILFIINSEKRIHIKDSIIEATRINEMTAILGLTMLTIGTFLGGVWANESWGRYWSWDPKETWSWISILVYVILIHIRFIPSLTKNYYYNFAALSLVSYATIIMTFVGVNYYLSGMHSYAAGDPMPIPKYLYLIVAIVLILIALAYRKRELK